MIVWSAYETSHPQNLRRNRNLLALLGAGCPTCHGLCSESPLLHLKRRAARHVDPSTTTIAAWLLRRPPPKRPWVTPECCAAIWQHAVLRRHLLVHRLRSRMQSMVFALQHGGLAVRVLMRLPGSAARVNWIEVQARWDDVRPRGRRKSVGRWLGGASLAHENHADAGVGSRCRWMRWPSRVSLGTCGALSGRSREVAAGQLCSLITMRRWRRCTECTGRWVQTLRGSVP